MVDGAFELTGRVAVVTGGGSGIGAAIARLLAEAGADIVIAGRRREPLEAVAAEIRAATGRQCLAVPTDVGRSADVDRLMSQTIDAYGRLDILINNAGGALYAPLRAVTDAQWREGIGLNL